MQFRTVLLMVLVACPLSNRVLADAAAFARPLESAQDPLPADNRPELKALLAELDLHASKRGKEDQEAIRVIDQLLQEWEKSGPKDRATIIKGLDKCFNEKRQEDENGVRDNKLYLAAATALGQMAPDSVPVFLKWIGDKAHRKDLQLQRLMILKLGKSKTEAARDALIKLLNDEQNQIVAAAAEGLGEFGDIDQKLRKTTFETMLKVLMSAKAAVDASSSDPIAREKYDTIAAPIVTTLQRLTKHEEHDPTEWQRWWNKNKKEDWDAEK